MPVLPFGFRRFFEGFVQGGDVGRPLDAFAFHHAKAAKAAKERNVADGSARLFAEVTAEAVVAAEAAGTALAMAAAFAPERAPTEVKDQAQGEDGEQPDIVKPTADEI